MIHITYLFLVDDMIFIIMKHWDQIFINFSIIMKITGKWLITTEVWNEEINALYLFSRLY